MHKSTSGKVVLRVVAALVGAFVFAVVIVSHAPRASRAQTSKCPAEFQEQSSGPLTNGSTLCQTATGRTCTFQLNLCVNQPEAGCTPTNLRKRNIHATGSCGKVGKVHVKASGTGSPCGAFAGVTAKTKKHGTRMGTCTIKAKAGAGLEKITLTCQPASSPCSTSTTTTTTVFSTTSTSGPPPANSLSFTTTAGTTSCGGAGFSTPASQPFSGATYSDTGCTALLDNLGTSCLYIGGGAGSGVPPGATPAGATSYLSIGPGNTLVASNGTNTNRDCTKGSSTTSSHCINAGTCSGGPTPGATCFSATGCGTGGTCTGPNPDASCTTDADCGGTASSCQPVESCFFGPPLAIPYPTVPALSTCVLNVIATDASGTNDPATGAASVDIPLVSRVYLTGNGTAPCPQCKCGTPPCSGSGATGCNAGPNAGGACFTNSTTGNPATENTTHDCPPQAGGGLFNGALSVDLNPLTTGSASMTSAGGMFCPNQTHAGVFGRANAQCFTETGSPAGDLTDGMPHAATEGTVFCIPQTANQTVNLVADLPGPGATSLPGMAQLHF